MLRADLTIEWMHLGRMRVHPEDDPKLRELDERWGMTRVLYSIFVSLRYRNPLYTGIVYGQRSSVWARWRSPDKLEIREEMYERGLDLVDVVLGDIHLNSGANPSLQLFRDVESLLIWAHESPYNIHHRDHGRRCGRPGMVVECVGDWPGHRLYYDPGPGAEPIEYDD